MQRLRISVEQAGQLITEHCAPFGGIQASLSECCGRVLHEDVLADRDQPPFHRVAMDGIAIDYASWEGGRREFPIRGTHHAGRPQPELGDPDACFEVMTGAVLPGGCDCVIKVEDVEVRDRVAHVPAGATAASMQNVHQHGSDRRAGDVLVEKGTRLTSPHIAISASVGKSELCVDRQPRIALISNGDELVDVHEDVEPYQIRRSNVYGVEGALVHSGYTELQRFHLPDEQEVVERELETILGANDVLLLSGGVSAGQHDFIPAALQKHGVEQVFHKVTQRPGLPFWFGVSELGKTAFAMPGNPVATLVCFHRFVLPQLRASSGAPAQPEYATLAEDFEFTKSLTYFLPVKLTSDLAGQFNAQPKPTHGSGDFSSLAPTDGFLELPADRDRFCAGETFPFYRWQ